MITTIVYFYPFADADSATVPLEQRAKSKEGGGRGKRVEGRGKGEDVKNQRSQKSPGVSGAVVVSRFIEI